MRLLTIPNQSSTPKAFLEFDDTGRMKPSPYYDRVVDVMEELVKFTLAHARQQGLPSRPLQRAEGERRRAVEAGESDGDLTGAAVTVRFGERTSDALRHLMKRGHGSADLR